MRIAVGGWTPATVAYGDETDFRCSTIVDAPEHGVLRFDGIATLATVVVDGEPVASSRSMWLPVEVPLSAGRHSIEVHCHPLAPELEVARKPRARWRQKVASHPSLRWFRTTLNGRAPGFAPGPPVVGLWRPVWFVSGEPKVSVRASLDGAYGLIAIVADVPDGTPVRVADVQMTMLNGHAELRVREPKLWWPHTHGEPCLYDVQVEDAPIRRVGFRTIDAPGDILRDGLRPQINGLDVFVRGAVWTPVPDGELRSTLLAARDHGLNAVRLAGTMTYESAAFHDLCDELGILVWQDLMFANFDYPFADPEFRQQVDLELDALIDQIGGRPSTFCICGNSEVEQQAAMFGVDPVTARDAFFAEDVPAALAQASVDALYVPSAPCGADRPLITSQGVSNWFGVGGYRRPFSDVRSAGVRFASECLAIGNVGDDVPDPNDPAWKAGVPKDVGADWDFDDVRDHYLELLYDVNSHQLRQEDPERWLALSRKVSGDVMSEVFGEWRAGSECRGAFVLWLRDLVPGAGWGLLDSSGRPKPVLRTLSRVLAPLAIWMTDEGMSGYKVHAANDGPSAIDAMVAIGLWRSGQQIDGGTAGVTLPPHGRWSADVETIIGRWVDVGYAYRFGPPAHDRVTAELIGHEGRLLASGERFPLGPGGSA